VSAQLAHSLHSVCPTVIPRPALLPHPNGQKSHAMVLLPIKDHSGITLPLLAAEEIQLLKKGIPTKVLQMWCDI
jgi:hypothetical protein